ncbi:MAG TPA: ROK family protein [Clostridiales bacterium]|nr:ROK family protein [Clostridiales bacterium]
MKRSYSAADIRARNFRIVFELAKQKGEVLRPDISTYTGMTPPTVMKVVQSFLSRNILQNAGEVNTSLGRKPTKLVFNPNAAYAIGVLFEGNELRAGLVNLAGEIIDITKLSMAYTFSDEFKTKIISCISRLAESNRGPILGVGLGVPGVVDTKKKIIAFAPLIGITTPYDCTQLCSEITGQTGLPVIIDNDVNLAAVGEFSVRKLTGSDDLLYISIGTGVGAGIMLNGKLRRGARYLAGELGYAVKDTSYRVDREKPGWLESQVGQKALMERFNWQGYNKTSMLPEGMVDYLVDNLAPPVANLVTQLDIKEIVIGGMAVDTIGETLRDKLQEKIDMLSLEKTNISLSICSDSGATGAAMAAIENNLDNWLNEREE